MNKVDLFLRLSERNILHLLLVQIFLFQKLGRFTQILENKFNLGYTEMLQLAMSIFNFQYENDLEKMFAEITNDLRIRSKSDWPIHRDKSSNFVLI